jgi:hypothetical protein
MVYQFGGFGGDVPLSWGGVIAPTPAPPAIPPVALPVNTPALGLGNGLVIMVAGDVNVSVKFPGTVTIIRR